MHVMVCMYQSSPTRLEHNRVIKTEKYQKIGIVPYQQN